MIQLILSIFLLTNPCFAAFTCVEDSAVQLSESHFEKCHESTKAEMHSEKKSEAHSHQEDHCSVYCNHSVVLLSYNVPQYARFDLSQKFSVAEFLYISPSVESFKRPPIQS